jgi:hypothetical protein
MFSITFRLRGAAHHQVSERFDPRLTTERTLNEEVTRPIWRIGRPSAVAADEGVGALSCQADGFLAKTVVALVDSRQRWTVRGLLMLAALSATALRRVLILLIALDSFSSQRFYGRYE